MTLDDEDLTALCHRGNYLADGSGDYAFGHGVESLVAEVRNLRAEVATMKRGYLDLHAMMPGNKDVWSKVDDLQKQLQRYEALLVAARGVRQRRLSVKCELMSEDRWAVDELNQAVDAIDALDTGERNLAPYPAAYTAEGEKK